MLARSHGIQGLPLQRSQGLHARPGDYCTHGGQQRLQLRGSAASRDVSCHSISPQLPGPPAGPALTQVTEDAAFYHLHGSSWHADDAALIFWLDRHKMALVVAGSLLAACLAGSVLLRWVLQSGRYRPLKSEE